MSRAADARPKGSRTSFREESAGWPRQRVHEGGCSRNEVVRSLVQDQRTRFRLPSMMGQRLNGDRGERSGQQYLVDLLTARYDELIEPRRTARRRTGSQP